MSGMMEKESCVSTDFANADDIVALGVAVAAAQLDLELAQRLQNEVASYGKGKMSFALRQDIAAAAQRQAKISSQPRMLDGQDELSRILVETCLGTQVEEDERLMLLDQSGLLDKPSAERKKNEQSPRRIGIIGAGVSGLAVGRELLQGGYEISILERSSCVSGAWSHNRYPGCGVDSPSYVYSYSYAQKPDWSRYFVRRSEIDSYINACAEEFGLLPYIQFETEVLSCTYDQSQCLWEVISRNSEGHETTETYHSIVSAVGQLNTPAYPNIEGIEQFSGTLVHTAEWQESTELAGKRVAVIGVGASAMQVAPTIAPMVKHLSVFQRQPHWVMPNRQYLSDVSANEIQILSAFPDYLAWKRLAYNWAYGDSTYPALIKDPEWQENEKDAINPYSARVRNTMVQYIKKELAGRSDLIEKMVPSYPPYSKRVLLDNNWYKTFLRDNVSLVTDNIVRITESGIETAQGGIQDFDVIVLATGFQASQMLSTFAVNNAQGETLQGVWNNDDPRAYLGTAVPGFPNFFIMYGPNTNLVFGSAIIHSEIQSSYITQCLDGMYNAGFDEIECLPESYEQYNKQVDEQLAQMVWADSKATSWFMNKSGRVTTNSAWSMAHYWALMREPDLSAYRLGTAKIYSEHSTCPD